MSGHSDKTEETRIRNLLENWADAVRRHDLSAILAHHEPDMVMFDLPPPLQCKGRSACARSRAAGASPTSTTLYLRPTDA